MDLTALAAGRGGRRCRPCSCPARRPTCPERWEDASPITHVDPTDAPLLLANSDDELVPVDQARAMAARLDTAGVVHQLVVVPGRRHGHDLRDEVWPATVAFLDDHLTRPTDLRDPNPTAARGCSLVVIVVVVTGGVDRRPAGAAPPQRQAASREAGPDGGGHAEVVGREQRRDRRATGRSKASQASSTTTRSLTRT